MRLVVSDASPLRSLHNVGLLRLVIAIECEIHVPRAVWTELTEPDSRLAPVPPDAIGIVTVHDVRDRAAVDRLLSELDAGESEAIVLAREIGADSILIDELQGRQVAGSMGLHVIGVVGLLKQLKGAGLIKLVRPHLIDLRQNHQFWISQSLIDSADVE